MLLSLVQIDARFFSIRTKTTRRFSLNVFVIQTFLAFSRQRRARRVTIVVKAGKFPLPSACFQSNFLYVLHKFFLY